MARTFERRRDEVIAHIAERIGDTTDSRLRREVGEYCVANGIPATSRDIDDIVSEALRRKLIEKIKDLDARIDQARTAFLALKAKVDSYHP